MGKKGGEEAKTDAPAAAAFVQTQGPTVLVDPVLMSNTEAKTDLELRNVIIDGVNGFDYVQTNAEQTKVPNDELLTLQVHGVPVLVDPVLMTNTESKADLELRNIVIDGVNGFDYV